MLDRFSTSGRLWLVAVLACVGLAGCDARPPDDADADPATSGTTAAGPALSVSFDGADAEGDAKLDHGERIATLLGCNSCHGEDYTGANFGEVIPLLDGLWATNISRTMPEMGDAELERLLREGVHPDREIYLMPSKQSQFLSARDMGALIAFLRTIEPAGEPTPPPPEGFEEAVTARLPADYWRASLDGHPQSYHNAAEEVEYFAAKVPRELGPETARGRLVALTVCTACHGAALDGLGEPAGDIQATLEYSDAEYVTLLRDGVQRDGAVIELPWGTGHAPAALSDGEVEAVFAYVRRLATARAEGAD